VQKLHYLLLFILIPFTLLGQKKTKITLVNSQHSTVDLKSNISYLRKPVFKQDNAILSCDSAVFYEARNVFEAYDNVHINQADTVNIYSDRLTYDGNTKMAHLSSNVRLLDRTSVLTTNILDYNMGTKVGTYVQGGKIVSKDVTVTSKNGYYFANSRDSYFRYDVVVVSPEVRIQSDTMRYNTLNSWTYFYGPTNIKGKDDNLYTENGAYNTKSEYAYFGLKNLYTNGSKSLKGDSLYYDGKAGYGKAVRNIIFTDTTDRTVLYGQLGYYYKADERTVVTKNAYVGMGKDSIKVDNVLRPDTLWLGADTLETQMVLRQTLKLVPRPVVKKDNEIGSESPEAAEETKAARKKRNAEASGKADDESSDVIKKAEASGNPPSEGNAKAKEPDPKKDPDADKAAAPKNKKRKKKDNQPLDKKQTDSLSIPKAIDSLQQVSKKPDALAQSQDSTKQALGVVKNTLKDTVTRKAITQALSSIKDSLVKATVKDNVTKKATAQVGKKKAADSAKLKPAVVLNPLDTVKARAIKAYHNVKVYKSNLQAKSDSLFYNSADSTLRWFHSPVMWAEGSQQTGDTIYLQMKNSKLSSVQVLQNAFAVNVEKDSSRFNQVKGKLMTGFFKEGKIQTLYVDGNAESVYYTRDEAKGVYKEMNQTVSSRLKITFKDDAIADLVTIREAESAITPINKLKEDVFLTGFIWKPELRPLSKRDITNPNRKKAKALVTAKSKSLNAKGKAGEAKASTVEGEEETALTDSISSGDNKVAPLKSPTSKTTATPKTSGTSTVKLGTNSTPKKEVPVMKKDSTQVRPILTADSLAKKPVK
jgi:lipopolysaccharide export system protein LptA